MVEEFDGEIREANFTDPFDFDINLDKGGIGRVLIPRVRGVLRMIVFDPKSLAPSRFAIKPRSWPIFLLKSDFISKFTILYPKAKADDIGGGKFIDVASDVYVDDELELIVEGPANGSVRLLLRFSTKETNSILTERRRFIVSKTTVTSKLVR